MRFLLFVCCLFAIQSVDAMSWTASHQEVSFSEAVGVQTISLKDEKRNRPVMVEVWYPLHSSYAGIELVRDAPMASVETGHPLILISHGHKGQRQDYAWLAVQLARKGYIVAAVDHFGNTRDTFNPLLSLKFWDRPKDISFALSSLLDQFSGKIDQKRIGFIGYSLGGMTGLGLAGAQAKNAKEVALTEFRKHKGFSEKVIAELDFSEGEQPLFDERIKALLLLCPANFVYSPESLKQIKKPIGLVAVFHDETLPHKSHAYPIICNVVPQKIKLIREKVSHSFLLQPKAEKVCREVALFSLEFFKTYLSPRLDVN